MMEMDEGRFSLAGIRETDMVGYLDKLGYQPEKVRRNGTDFWYLSPLRDENTASFHVNQVNNEWYDFGLAAGGNMVDFCLRYYRCSIPELLERFNVDFPPRQLRPFDPVLHEGRLADESKLLVKSVRQLYAYPLKSYLHERSVPMAVADLYCQEVSYEIKGRTYYGIGFKNDAGGYEIRNKNYKMSSAPKEITTISFGADSVQVFEGFFDFLSYLVLQPDALWGSTDFVVLNGAGLFNRALPFLEQHEQAGLWLDRDVTGRAYTQYALSLGSRYVDESELYSEHKDLNDRLIRKGEVPKERLKVSSGLRPAG